MENIWVDFKVVKAAVTMQMVLGHYNINWLGKKGDELRGRCPIHKGEGQNTFHASIVKNNFQCFSCKKKGNVLDLVAAMEQCSVRDAAVKLAEWFSLATKSESERMAELYQEHVGPLPEHVRSAVQESRTAESGGEGTTVENKPLTFQLKGVEPDHPYVAGRGLDHKTAELFGVGFFPGKGSMSGRVVIPIHNERGELIAYAGRAIDGSEPRYKLPAGFQKSLELFNLHRAVQFKNRSVVIVVEGFFDCMRVHQTRYPCVALMGSSMSEQQELLLRRHFTGAVLLLDSDEAGRSATDACLLRLGRGWWIKAVMMPDGIQPDMLESEEIQELLEG
jgi:DNA primase